jgi:chorismate mutase/prephenate dehydratase pheA
LVIGKEKLYLEGAKTVSLMMETKHEAGALYHVLGALYGEGINLLRLAARPVPEISWAYRFFLDCAGSLEDAAVQRALREVERLSTNLRILGCF